ncbi:MAG: restriction endonuclease subunit S [Proteobacteria bacterium]|nr:restriction endonuclease subunit S [Pseudomonadota bacterium]
MKYGLSENQLGELLLILKVHPEVEEAVLFGSRAMDTFKEASDIDIAVKGEGITQKIVLTLLDAFEESNLPFFVDVVNYQIIYKPKFKQHIDRKGTSLFLKGMGEWREYKLDDIAEIHNQKRVPLSKMERSKRQGGFPYYGASGIVDYIDSYIFDGDFVLISEDGENLRSRNTPIAFRASGKFWVNNHAHIIKGKKSFYNDLIIYFFKNLDLNEYITGAVQPKLSKSSLLSISLLLPKDEVEQSKLVKILRCLDDKIELLHRQNKTLEAIAETLFRQWFIEEAQDDWEEKPLGDVAVVQNGFAFSSRDYVEYQNGYLEVFKMGHIQPGGGLRFSPKADFVPREAKLERWVLKKGDIVMAMTDMKDSMGILAHPAMIDISNKYVLNQRVARIYLENDDNLVSNHFLYLQLNTEETISLLQSKSNSGVQVNLSTEAIKSFPLVIPPKPVQNKILKKINPVLLRTLINREQIKTLEKLRDTLLPKLMSGEVRVKH